MAAFGTKSEYFELSFLHVACGAQVALHLAPPGATGRIKGFCGSYSISAPIVEALIKHGANVNEEVDWRGMSMTPLDFAVFAVATALGNKIEYSQLLENQKKTVQLLIENGANPETVMPRLEQRMHCYNLSEDSAGNGIEHLLTEEVMKEVMDEFKEILEGKHSLLAAAAVGNAQLVSKYIATGADVGARNLCGQTALLLACL